MIWLAAAHWPKWVLSFGPVVPAIWIAINLLLLITALAPHRTPIPGFLHRSDGLALLEIPRMSTTELAPYLSAVPLMQAWHRCEVSDYVGAKAEIQQFLRRAPDNLTAKTILAASLIGLERYTDAGAQLTEVEETLSKEPPDVRAMVLNALAVAVLLKNARGPEGQSEREKADRLSREAYEAFPCVLEYRCTRALILAATGSPESALSILEYPHFATGTPRQRAHREAARAFAFQRLGHHHDADQCMHRALELDQGNAGVLRALGLFSS